MTHPSDKALAQAFVERFERRYTPLTVRLVMEEVTARARELDAEKGGERVTPLSPLAEIDAYHRDAAKPEQVHTCSYYCNRPECLKAQRDELRDRLEATPPAQAAEAVARAAALGSSGMGGYDTELFWSCLDDRAREHWRTVARAAIAAMRAGATGGEAVAWCARKDNGLAVGSLSWTREDVLSSPTFDPELDRAIPLYARPAPAAPVAVDAVEITVEPSAPRTPPGGQHIGNGGVGVKVTHKPTGITVVCEHERSQHKNRAACLAALAAALGVR